MNDLREEARRVLALCAAIRAAIDGEMVENPMTYALVLGCLDIVSCEMKVELLTPKKNVTEH